MSTYMLQNSLLYIHSCKQSKIFCKQQNVLTISVNTSAITVLFNKILVVEVLLKLVSFMIMYYLAILFVLFNTCCIKFSNSSNSRDTHHRCPSCINWSQGYGTFFPLHVATHGTQEVQFSVQNDNVCIFAIGSTARGCYVYTRNQKWLVEQSLLLKNHLLKQLQTLQSILVNHR